MSPTLIDLHHMMQRFQAMNCFVMVEFLMKLIEEEVELSALSTNGSDTTAGPLDVSPGPVVDLLEMVV